MTRAKQNLTIHLNSGFLSRMRTENLVKIEDRNINSSALEMVLNPGFRDVWLDYFTGRQYLVNKLTSGDALIVKEDECLIPDGQSVLKFSQQFIRQLSELKEKGYELKSAKVNFIVYWTKEETGMEYKIILPELVLAR